MENIHAYIPFENVKKTYNVKKIKDVRRIIEEQIETALDETISGNSMRMTIWDDSGSRCKQIGFSYTIESDDENSIEKVKNVMGHIAVEIEDLDVWLDNRREMRRA